MAWNIAHATLIAIIVFVAIMTSFVRGAASRNADVANVQKLTNETLTLLEHVSRQRDDIANQRDRAIALAQSLCQ